MSLLNGIPALVSAVPADIPSPSVGVWHLGPIPIRGYAMCILAGIIVDRSGGTTEVRSESTGRVTPVRSLWTLDVPTYEAGPATCPACARGEALVAPGSTGTKPA